MISVENRTPNHVAILKLAKLRGQEYRNSFGVQVNGWNIDDDAFKHVDEVQSTAYNSLFNNSAQILPTYQQLVFHSPVQGSDWVVVFRSFGCQGEVFSSERNQSKVARHAALMPSWWHFDVRSIRQLVLLESPTYIVETFKHCLDGTCRNESIGKNPHTSC